MYLVGFWFVKAVVEIPEMCSLYLPRDVCIVIQNCCFLITEIDALVQL